MQILLAAPKPQASIEAREVKFCIQGDGLAKADEKIQRGGFHLENKNHKGKGTAKEEDSE